VLFDAVSNALPPWATALLDIPDEMFQQPILASLKCA
jgi:hypothetical protein